MLPSAERALATLWSPRKRRNEEGDYMVALFSLGLAGVRNAYRFTEPPSPIKAICQPS